MWYEYRMLLNESHFHTLACIIHFGVRIKNFDALNVLCTIMCSPIIVETAPELRQVSWDVLCLHIRDKHRISYLHQLQRKKKYNQTLLFNMIGLYRYIITPVIGFRLAGTVYAHSPLPWEHSSQAPFRCTKYWSNHYGVCLLLGTHLTPGWRVAKVD